MTAQGRARKHDIVLKAYVLAQMAGLEGITIGSVAALAGISKSGLCAHFETRQDLQLSVLKHAGQLFLDTVLVSSLKLDRGLPRLQHMMHQWFETLRDAGPGRLLIAAASEYDDRAGPMQELVAEYQTSWRAEIERAISMAIGAGDLAPTVEFSQLGFELCGAALALHHQTALVGYEIARQRAERFVDRLLPR